MRKKKVESEGKSKVIRFARYKNGGRMHVILNGGPLVFSLFRVTSALASIAISHRILFCVLVLHCRKEASFHSVWL